jgi:hypothetical protein
MYRIAVSSRSLVPPLASIGKSSFSVAREDQFPFAGPTPVDGRLAHLGLDRDSLHGEGGVALRRK